MSCELVFDLGINIIFCFGILIHFKFDERYWLFRTSGFFIGCFDWLVKKIVLLAVIGCLGGKSFNYDFFYFWF